MTLPSSSAQQSSEVLPNLVQHAEPIYPPLAAQTRIAGDVRIEFSTNGESVTDVLVESSATPCSALRLRAMFGPGNSPATHRANFM